MSAIVPSPKVAVSVRLATLDDLAFIDGLQKQHSKQLGHFSNKWFEEYIKSGGVLIAEAAGQRVGYVISRDRYLKRDELGIVYQLCVAPVEQRKLIGASLIKAVFERSAYGCRLYSCWCAQDIEANRFWESLGFVPIAFRAGSKGKRRIHIFWQRRIREGDTTTPYWFPSQTNAGTIREDRLVFPIPPGTHWSDAKPIILPKEETPKLEDRSTKQVANRKSNEKRALTTAMIGMRFESAKPAASKAGVKGKKAPRKKAKHDPRHIAAARELRDRYLEHVNAPGGASAMLPAGKYDVTRALPDVRETTPALPAPKAA